MLFTVKIADIGTSRIFAVIILTVWFIHTIMCIKDKEGIVNSVDLNLSLHCLPRSVRPIIWNQYGIFFCILFKPHHEKTCLQDFRPVKT